ncbi:hypothetical protein MIND_01318800 [Mycena indigotica]|uniref:BTB domain-containing protein n=1 Tax=Mycena indigotica TaxID=2126181 RepID=A0A8H6S0Q6_9AGAR|nr:uncharacterized protein MIND_01318800 [Mycena indigotica]KAF7290779.1 hypothetical protein MIND_01318800 [Mycena indigotica]
MSQDTPQAQGPQNVTKIEHDPFQSNAALTSDFGKRSRDQTPIDPSESPVAKRARSSRRHAKHWDLDGDIFVRLGDCWMRLRKSALGRHSEFFSDAFIAIDQGKLSPEPKRPYEQGTLILADVSNVQNCYHLPAPGATAVDLDALLTAMEDAISYCHEPPTFDVVSSILRASTILKFHRFRDWAQRFIQSSWLPSLEALTPTVIPHATQVVSLGREVDLGPSGAAIIKRALYELLRTPSFGQKPEQMPSMLQSTDLIALTRAREHLDTIWYTATAFEFFAFFCPAHGTAQPEPRCTILTQQIHKKLIYDSGLFIDYRYDVLCGLDMLGKVGWDKEAESDNEGGGAVRERASMGEAQLVVLFATTLIKAAVFRNTYGAV